MREMTVYGVSFDLVGKQPIVLLKTQDGNTFLPIWIGHPEAAAILMNLQGTEPPRPMTHDLATSDHRLARRRDPPGDRDRAARQHLLRADHARPRTAPRSSSTRAPSDAIALALRSDAKIFAADDVIEESGVEFEGDEEEASRRLTGQRVARRPRSGRVPPLPRHRLARRVRGRARGRGRRGDRRTAAGQPRATRAELALRQVEQVGHEPVEPLGRERPGARRRQVAPAGSRSRSGSTVSSPSSRLQLARAPSRARAAG